MGGLKKGLLPIGYGRIIYNPSFFISEDSEGNRNHNLYSQATHEICKYLIIFENFNTICK